MEEKFESSEKVEEKGADPEGGLSQNDTTLSVKLYRFVMTSKKVNCIVALPYTGDAFLIPNFSMCLGFSNLYSL